MDANLRPTERRFNPSQEVPLHMALPNYDQQMVYTHAMLALTGHDVYLASTYLDE